MKTAKDFRRKAAGRIDRMVKRWMTSCGYQPEVEKCWQMEKKLLDWLDHEFEMEHTRGFNRGVEYLDTHRNERLLNSSRQ